MKLALEVLAALLVSALGVVAVSAGETDDAPGLVGIGCLLVAAAVALGVRAGRRSRFRRAADAGERREIRPPRQPRA